LDDLDVVVVSARLTWRESGARYDCAVVEYKKPSESVTSIEMETSCEMGLPYQLVLLYVEETWTSNTTLSS